MVGVSKDRRKFGNVVFDLRAAGYHVYGVHPSGESVDGQTIYPTLAALPEQPEVVDLVVPPDVTEQIVRQCHELGLTRVWMQPGAASREAVQFCQANGIEVISGGPCAMVHKRRWQE